MKKKGRPYWTEKVHGLEDMCSCMIQYFKFCRKSVVFRYFINYIQENGQIIVPFSYWKKELCLIQISIKY